MNEVELLAKALEIAVSHLYDALGQPKNSLYKNESEWIKRHVKWFMEDAILELADECVNK